MGERLSLRASPMATSTKPDNPSLRQDGRIHERLRQAEAARKLGAADAGSWDLLDALSDAQPAVKRIEPRVPSRDPNVQAVIRHALAHNPEFKHYSATSDVFTDYVFATPSDEHDPSPVFRK